MWSHYGGNAQLSFIRVGSLDDPDAFPPDIHIFTSTKQPWVQLSGGVPAVRRVLQQPEDVAGRVAGTAQGVVPAEMKTGRAPECGPRPTRPSLSGSA